MLELSKKKAPESLDRLPTQIGHYEIKETIGKGSFGKVKVGIHTPTGEKVAIKVLNKSQIRLKEDLTRVQREMKILKKLRHPNVLQLYEVSV